MVVNENSSCDFSWIDAETVFVSHFLFKFSIFMLITDALLGCYLANYHW